MEIEIGRGKKARRAYGFDDIAIVPSRRTRDPDDVDVSWKLGPYRFELPLMASAMDGVVSPSTAGIIGKLGGLAVLNLEGIFTVDVSSRESVHALAETAATLGDVTGVVHAAGVSPSQATAGDDPRRRPVRHRRRARGVRQRDRRGRLRDRHRVAVRPPTAARSPPSRTRRWRRHRQTSSSPCRCCNPTR